MMNKGTKFIGGLKLLWYYRIFKRFQEFTMVDRDAYIANLYLVERALAAPGLDAGCIIECGTWRGGMAAGLLTVGGASRKYHFFDSFMGLPPAGIEDGEEARHWQANKDGPRFFNNCSATMEEFMKVVGTVDILPKHFHVYKGFFEETFLDFQVPPISVLRLDADWYNSTMMCLQKFWDNLLPGAIVVIDDYYDWEGCRKALHAFLAQRNARDAIRQSCFGRVCYILKI